MGMVVFSDTSGSSYPVAGSRRVSPTCSGNTRPTFTFRSRRVMGDGPLDFKRSVLIAAGNPGPTALPASSYPSHRGEITPPKLNRRETMTMVCEHFVTVFSRPRRDRPQPGRVAA
jgi:hypothetical protein